MAVLQADNRIDTFIALGGLQRGGACQLQLFASELCDLLGVGRPDPAKEDRNLNDYTFERSVEFKETDGATSHGRIDLYKKHCFVMEAKQSREKGRPKELKIVGHPDRLDRAAASGSWFHPADLRSVLGLKRRDG